jgi:hypothetical protein
MLQYVYLYHMFLHWGILIHYTLLHVCAQNIFNYPQTPPQNHVFKGKPQAKSETLTI